MAVKRSKRAPLAGAELAGAGLGGELDVNIKAIQAALARGERVQLTTGEAEPGDLGTWFTPEPGDLLERMKIKRVFFVIDHKRNNEARPAYALEDTEPEAGKAPELVLLSEKSDMKKLRLLNMESIITMEFVEKKDRGATDKWNIAITLEAMGEGANVMKVMELEYAKITSGVFRDFRTVKREGEDAPF